MNDTPTPRTKEIWGAMLYTYPFLINCVNETGEMEAELTAAREEITLLKTNLKIQTNHTENAVQDRADEHIELHNQIQELTEQRDRLAEALERILDYQGRFAEEDPESIAKEALKSLAPNK